MTEPSPTPAPADPAPAPAPAPTDPAKTAAPAPAPAADPAKTEPAPADPAKPPEGGKEPTSLLGGEPAAPQPIENAADYKIEVPDGVTIDKEVDPVGAAHYEAFLEAAAKHKLTNETAQGIFSELAPKIAEARNEPYKLFAQQQKDWQTQVKADAEIGGAKLDENLGRMKSTLEQYAGKDAKELLQALDATGIGNNPAFLRTLHRMAGKLSEGQPVKGGPAGQGKKPGGLTAESFYPKMMEQRNGVAS